MGLIRWLTRNWADTDEPTHADVTPRDLPVPPAAGLDRVAAAVAALPRWAVESRDDATGTLHATRRTRLARFVDDVRIRLELTATGCRLHARSQSRLGKGDFGQNRRNLLELFAELDRVGASS